MYEPFIGSEAVAQGMPWGELQRRHNRIFRDVYVAAEADVTAVVRARAAWLWSRRRGVVAGFAAASLHGSNWVDRTLDVDIYHDNRHRLPGLNPRAEQLSSEDICMVDGVPLTTPARTAVDLGCWYPLMKGLAGIDALARATELKIADIELVLARQGRRRGIVGARRAIGLADPGAQSPKESWLRAVLIEAGLPRPQTQIPVRDENGTPIAYLDMGWEYAMVAAEYDGDHHRTRRSQYSYDIRRLEMLQRRGWTIIRVTVEHSASDVVRRVRDALSGYLNAGQR